MEQLTPDTLTGPAIVDYLECLGAQFCITDGKLGRKVCDDHGQPIAGSYLDNPASALAAKANLTRKGGVGLLTHISNGLTALDIDAGLESFFAMWPDMAEAPRVVRDSAPDRAKILILVVDQAGKMTRQDAAEPTRKAELLGKGHANVAGRHPSGAEYVLVTGRLLIFTRAQVEQMLSQWIPEAHSAYNERPASVIPRPAQPLSSGDQVRQAIAAWNANPSNVAEVDRLLGTCPKSGRYLALRADDRTPSTIRTDERDGYSKRTWRDHGTNRTLDAYELYCILSGTDKSAHKWQVVQEWRESQGLRPLQLH